MKKTLLALTLLASTQVYAYTIYNNLDHSVQVKDRHGFRGMNVTMTPHSSSACNPADKACRGKISFAVYATQAKGQVVCTWDGTLRNGPGNYFTINPVAGKNYPQTGSCFVEYYHD